MSQERVGYRTVAIDHVLEETVFESKKKKKKGEPRDNTDLVPPPRNIANLIKVIVSHGMEVELTGVSWRKEQVFSRRGFLEEETGGEEVDIITFNPEGTNRVRFNRKMYNMAAERGIYFELMYTPSIRDATARKNTISMAHMYHAYGKSKVNKDVSVYARQYSTDPAEGRRYGKAVITVSQRGALDEEKSEEETEDMEVDDVEPAQKRLRQTNE
uniref:Uncharacterized protein n=1 Tax=Timema tahoe TaxID=61484 RepID=A0A7R9FHT0_9NEOP|nr:unnamed protein product [Timema tahoe]